MKRINKLIIVIAPATIVVFLAGLWIGQRMARTPHPEHGSPQDEQAGVKFWTCSMHPQIHLPAPGKCPLCGMSLIPVRATTQGTPLGPRQLMLSPAAIQLARIEVAPVERRFPVVDVRMVGKVDYDESKLSSITAWVGGRLDRLYVDYTGVPVRKGDHLVHLYSPALLTAQEELLQALLTARELEKSEQSFIRQRAQATIEAAREKLRLWGLKAEQIRQIESSGKTSDHLTIYSPVSGIVVEKHALEGMYVTTGTRIYTIADFSKVWVKLNAYESDLAWIHYGQKVDLETEAYPGEKFNGRIAFIDPVLDPKTRTVKLRVNVDNADARLKPGMFVRAIVRSPITADGKVIDPSLAGKWISPMHPEIVKDAPGTCDVCGMALVKAEDLGYLPVTASEGKAPLVIPASAPLITGKRAVAYVSLTNQPGVYEGRELVLGPRAGDFYVVREGLSEGDLVVVNGNFKIDSAIQILAKPSMMSPEGGAPPPGHDHGDPVSAPATPTPVPAQERLPAPPPFQTQLTGVFAAYLTLQQALADDKAGAARNALSPLRQTLAEVDMKLVKGEAHALWMKLESKLEQSLQNMTAARKIEGLRVAFEPLSDALNQTIRAFGLDSTQKAFVVHCPMAFNNRGANWLQNGEDVRNPYFGHEMLECGEVVKALTRTPDGPEHRHETEGP